MSEDTKMCQIPLQTRHPTANALILVTMLNGRGFKRLSAVSSRLEM